MKNQGAMVLFIVLWSITMVIVAELASHTVTFLITMLALTGLLIKALFDEAKKKRDQDEKI